MPCRSAQISVVLRCCNEELVSISRCAHLRSACSSGVGLQRCWWSHLTGNLHFISVNQHDVVLSRYSTSVAHCILGAAGLHERSYDPYCFHAGFCKHAVQVGPILINDFQNQASTSLQVRVRHEAWRSSLSIGTFRVATGCKVKCMQAMDQFAGRETVTTGSSVPHVVVAGLAV